MEKQMICIICPRGCTITAKTGEQITVTGNACKRGEDYAIAELTNPTRTVTSTVRVKNRYDTMVSVKTENPIPKGKMADAMTIIRSAEAEAPIKIGDVILKDVFGTKIIATKAVK